MEALRLSRRESWTVLALGLPADAPTVTIMESAQYVIWA